MSALSYHLGDLSPETQAAIKVGADAVAELVLERDDLILLVAYMASEDYTTEDIALAVERPWKYVDVLAEAKAALEVQA